MERLLTFTLPLFYGRGVFQYRCARSLMCASTGCPKWAETWVGLTLISVFHHLAQLPSQFFQIPISLSWVGQAVEHSKSKSTKPSLSSLGTPCITPKIIVCTLNLSHQILQLWHFATPTPDNCGCGKTSRCWEDSWTNTRSGMSYLSPDKVS